MFNLGRKEKRTLQENYKNSIPSYKTGSICPQSENTEASLQRPGSAVSSGDVSRAARGCQRPTQAGALRPASCCPRACSEVARRVHLWLLFTGDSSAPRSQKTHVIPSCLALTRLLLSILSSRFGTLLTTTLVLSVL